MQFTASFLSEKSGDFKANLFLSYESELDLRQVSEDTFFLLDTKCLATAIEDKCRKLQSADYRSSAGEKLCLSLQSSSANCTIRIDRSSVRMEDTYLGLSRSKVLTIHNRSDHTVKFQWMCFKDKSSDVERKDEYGRLFQLVRDTEVARRVDLVHYNVCLPDTHELICQRIYVDEIASLMNEDFRYNHASFLLTPEQGEIWPHSCADVTVIFRATKVGEISSVAYLEVTGREDRISLSLHGVGKGPLLRLNVITMDLKNIYLCSVHNYEIVAANKGHINGTLIHKARPTDFGGTVTVSPLCLILEPNEYKSFNLSFSSNRKGDFMERVDFVVEESSEVLSLHIKGCVVCPTLHFDKSSLDFGVVGLGFSKRQEVHLRNLSLVAVSFGATIMDDGDQAPLTHEEFARSDARASFPANPREFVVIPHKGVVQAYNSLKLKVMYTANVVRSGQSTVRVDMWDSESDPVLLPISFCGAIPTLSITPAEIPIRFSFLNFPYLRSINVENNSDLDGYFYIVPQAISEDIPVVYSMSSHQGFLKARQSMKIDITVITKVLGKQQVILNMLTMGEQAPVTSCTIICNGQGPVVSVEPAYLEFGDIQVLQEQITYFRIINDSPIPAQFKLTADKKHVPWLVNPISGEVGPNESTEVEVKIFLRDPGKYTGAVMLQVTNSRLIPINVIASGIGCSVIFEPHIYPMFDMGFLFSRQNQSLPITIKNLGTHRHQIIWSSDLEARVQKTHAPPISKFQVEPAIVDVPAGELKVVQCKICWDTNEVLTEDWHVFGHIHGQRKRKLLGTTTFKATFIEPRISFNKRELTFRIDICPDEGKIEQAGRKCCTVCLVQDRSGKEN
ncbi:Hydrocephalus-inducing protein-like protein [Harpegnathos saltator]|uniref:Hydrocephalus-inducing protein-like protein n=1 Tax=Harpegnathos saltator TaxID=610380 RepID=E2BEQ3_HARSA|nr:Hydrocephalus-inducing protein-like protein [Harpegnathos saltator]